MFDMFLTDWTVRKVRSAQIITCHNVQYGWPNYRKSGVMKLNLVVPFRADLVLKQPRVFSFASDLILNGTNQILNSSDPYIKISNPCQHRK